MSLEAPSPKTLPLTTPGIVSGTMADSPSTVLEASPPADLTDSSLEKSPSLGTVTDGDTVADPSLDLGTDLTTSNSLHPVAGNSPSAENVVAKAANVSDLTVLHVLGIPLSCNYEVLSKCFTCYGTIKEIRMRFVVSENSWEAWLLFSSHEAALRASCAIPTINVCS